MPPQHALTDADIAAIAAAVIAQMKSGHVCRFEESQAAVLHEAARRLQPDDVIVVAWLAHRLQSVGDAAGRWFGRCVIAGIVSLAILGLAGLGLAIKRGWIPGP